MMNASHSWLKKDTKLSYLLKSVSISGSVHNKHRKGRQFFNGEINFQREMAAPTCKLASLLAFNALKEALSYTCIFSSHTTCSIQFNTVWVVYFPTETGDGWGPAAINTEEEYDFLKEGQKSFCNSDSYWISGSISTELGQTFDFSDYNSSGKLVKLCHYFKNVIASHWKNKYLHIW